MGYRVLFPPLRRYYHYNKRELISGNYPVYKITRGRMPFIVWSRRCKKCKGQYFLEQTEDGAYLVCIQCGYSEFIIDEDLVTLLSAIQTSRKKEPTRV
jgi:hypothetical protein